VILETSEALPPVGAVEDAAPVVLAVGPLLVQARVAVLLHEGLEEVVKHVELLESGSRRRSEDGEENILDLVLRQKKQQLLPGVEQVEANL
jgi:hypothetical protein